MALVSWPTTGANSYSSRADATAYFADRIGSSAWTDATDANKDASLVTGTRMLDRQVWAGDKTDAAQPLEFPRTGLTDKDGNDVASDEIPSEILEALYELALILLADSTQAAATSTASSIKRLKAGSAEIEYFKGGKGTTFPSVVQKLIVPFLGSTGLAAGVGGVYSQQCEDIELFTSDGGPDYSTSGGGL